MNIKRFFLAAVVLFIFMFVYESFVHGYLLMSLYEKTPNIWRNYPQMKAYLLFNYGIMALLSLWITFIFAKIFSSSGWKNGLRFGFYLGIFSGLQAAGAYYYLPISWILAMAWFVFGVIESTLGGMLVGIFYRE